MKFCMKKAKLKKNKRNIKNKEGNSKIAETKEEMRGSFLSLTCT